MITKLTAEWTGFAGAPGYTNLYFGVLGSPTLRTNAAAAVRAFFATLPGYLPNNLTIRLNGIATDIDEATGALLSVNSYTPPTAVVGTNTTAYAGGSGASVRWLTGAVVGGRLVSGKTFLVPLVGAYDTDGTLAPAFVTTLGTAATTLATYVAYAAVGSPCVWHRPKAGVGGSAPAMSGAAVTDRAAGLRSRRT
jgi:hypothetical protein